MAQADQSAGANDRFDPESVQATAQRAVKDALLSHKRAGVPIVVWKDGKVVIVPAEQISVGDATGRSVDSQ